MEDIGSHLSRLERCRLNSRPGALFRRSSRANTRGRGGQSDQRERRPGRSGRGGPRRRPAARRPGRAAAAAATPRRAAGPRQQPDAEAGDDHVLHQLEAVGAVHDPGLEAGQRADRAHRLLVGGVARVHDPVLVAEPVEHRQRSPRPARGAGTPSPQAASPQRDGARVASKVAGRQVVVVGQREVDVVAASRPSASAGSCSRIRSRDVGVRRARTRTAGSSDWRTAVANAATRTVPGRRGGRVEVDAGGLERGEDGHGVVGQPAAGRGQPDPPAVGLDQRGAGLPGQRRDLLGDRRGGDVHAPRRPPASSRAGTARAAAPGGAGPCRHRSGFPNGLSTYLTWTRTMSRRLLGA